MRRRVGIVVLWAGATVAAVAVASAAIGTVVNRVSAGPPPLPAAQNGLVRTPEPGETATDPAPAPAPGAETRVFGVVGGSAAIRFDGGAVDVLWATPNSGFTVEVERAADGSEVTVDFRSDDHRSRVRGAVEGGRFVDRVREDPR